MMNEMAHDNGQHIAVTRDHGGITTLEISNIVDNSAHSPIVPEYVNLKTDVEVLIIPTSQKKYDETYAFYPNKNKHVIQIDSFEQLLKLQKTINELVTNRVMKFNPQIPVSRFADLDVVTERE